MEETQNRYSILENRINEIFENFSFAKDPLVPPTEREEDLIRAMVVLCHAEFEDYLEQLANRLIEEGKQKWLSEGVANKNIASLFMNSEKMKPSTPEQPMTIMTFSIKTITDFSNQVNNENHGIKAKNIESIYVPLGYDIDEFDQDFLNELDAFGSERGKIVHTSYSKTKNTLDLQSEKDKIKRVLLGIKKFEEKVLALSSSNDNESNNITN